MTTDTATPTRRHKALPVAAERAQWEAEYSRWEAEHARLQSIIVSLEARVEDQWARGVQLCASVFRHKLAWKLGIPLALALGVVVGRFG